MSELSKLTEITLKRLNLTPPKNSQDLEFLQKFQSSFFMQTPFENLSLQDLYGSKSALTQRYFDIAQGKRGGLCYDSGVIIKEILDTYGYQYKRVLAYVSPAQSSGGTHLIFVITVGENEWILDVGFGARGPRSLLKLHDGFEHVDSFLSSRVREDPTHPSTHQWTIEINENSTGWEAIYAFNNVAITDQDIEMAYFFTAKHPSSLLKKHSVCSIPIAKGRISFKDGEFTFLTASGRKTVKPAADEMTAMFRKYFAIDTCTEDGQQ